MRAQAFALMLLTGSAAVAWAGEPGPRTADEHLLLEVWINGFSTYTLAPIVLGGTKATMHAADLRAAGVQISSKEENIDLSQLEGISATIDLENQRLLLSVTA